MSSVDPTIELETELHVDLSARRRRGRPSVVIMLSFLILGLVVVCAVAGSAIAPVDPDAQDLVVGLSASGPGHPLGTDDLGRDVLSRVIAGARTAIVGPAIVAIGAMLIGSVLGLLAGYRGGLTDTIVMRWIDLMYSLPALLVAIVVAGVLGGGYAIAVALLTVLSSPSDTRLIRGAALEQRSRPYVEAAEAMGLSGRRVMVRHIWPNLLPIIVANSFLTFAFALVGLSALSFLGVGVDPSTPDWGRMLADSRLLLFDNAATALAPAIAIVATALSVNLIGDWLFETLSERGIRR
jgi:peptide/nickel transport system permease protein